MRFLFAVLLITSPCVCLISGQQRKLRPRYPLPARAKVIVDGGYNDILKDSGDHDACDRFHTTPEHIRGLFNTSAEISGPERHDGVDEVACGVSGQILLDGRTFSWKLVQSDPPGFIETDWPDGHTHMLAHRLGDLSDDPHPHRLSRYVDPTYCNQ